MQDEAEELDRWRERVAENDVDIWREIWAVKARGCFPVLTITGGRDLGLLVEFHFQVVRHH